MSAGCTRQLLLAIAIAACAAPALADPPAIRSPLGDIDAIQAGVRGVIESASPSVFAVTSFYDVPAADPRLWLGTLGGDAFSTFSERISRNCGSAFSIDADGLLLTNEHVVSGSASVWVTDDAGHVFPALVVGTDPRGDLAVLRIPTKTTPLAPADPNAAQRGDLVVTLGNPDGLSTPGHASASVGCVSATHRSLPTLSARERRSYLDLLQTTTPITAGSSGGPLIDLHGHAVGIVTAVAPSEGTRDAIGFAIDLAAPDVREAIERLVDGEEVTHGYLGVTVGDASERSTPATDGRPQIAGARIDAIEPDAPADGILRAGDVVLSFADQPIDSGDALSRLSATSPVDRDVAIRVSRAGRELDLTIRPRRRSQPIEPVTKATQSLAWAGARFKNAADGVEVVASDGPPLKLGSVVRAINGEPVPDLGELLRVLHDQAGKPLSLDLK